MPPFANLSSRALRALGLLTAAVTVAPLHVAGAQAASTTPWGQFGVTVHQVSRGFSTPGSGVLNNEGQVVGRFGYRAAIFSPTDGFTWIGSLGGSDSEAHGINNVGQVVGAALTSDGAVHAYRYGDGDMLDLGTLGGPISSARAINDAGDVVGWSNLPGTGAVRAFLYSDGAMQDLGAMTANDINSAGQIAGNNESREGGYRAAIRHRDGTLQDLGTLGGQYSDALAINDAGQVAGWSMTHINGGFHAFLFSDGIMMDLGTLGGPESRAFDIDNSGRLVGSAMASNGVFEAALWENGGSGYQAFSLADLVNDGVVNSGWMFNYAYDISDDGRFVLANASNSELGFGGWTVLEAQRSPTQTVTPEPATLALLGTGLAGLALVQRRRRRQVDQA